MTLNTQMHLLLLSELVFALRANDLETFRRWVAGGIHDLGKAAINGVQTAFSITEMQQLICMFVCNVNQPKTTGVMTVLGCVDEGPVLSAELAKPKNITKRQIERCISG